MYPKFVEFFFVGGGIHLKKGAPKKAQVWSIAFRALFLFQPARRVLPGSTLDLDGMVGRGIVGA